MTLDIKELVKRLREAHARVSLWPENRGMDGFMDLLALRSEVPNAIDALEAMAGEVVDLKKRLDIAQRWPTFSSAREAAEAAEAERDRLKAALQPFSDAYERLVRTQESMGFGDNATFGLGIKVSAIKAARKALGGDAS